MARMIDADIALKEILSIIEFRKQHYMDSKDYESFAKFIEQQPTIEAETVKHGQMRIEITTDDFMDVEVAKVKGFYRKHYFCPECGIEIGYKTFDENRQFGQGTVLHSNNFPNYCPNCGARTEDK